MMLIQPSVFDKKIITAAQSTRKGGLSQSPYDSLNLGKSTSDNPEHVLQNRKLFFSALGSDTNNVAMSSQVHGTEVLKATLPVMEKGYDAIITNVPDLTIAVSIADCTPILIHDTQHNAVAAIHAGWRGTVAGIAEKTIEKMKQHYNTNAADCLVFIGACIGYNAFEVGEDVAQHFPSHLKRLDVALQKYYVDLKMANKHQLLQCGVKEGNIEISPYCTVENNDLFFSHRKENGITGRMMAAIKINR